MQITAIIIITTVTIVVIIIIRVCIDFLNLTSMVLHMRSDLKMCIYL